MFASAILMNRMNSALHTDDDAPLEKAIKFAKSNLILQRTVMARGLVEIAHDIGYEDFVVHLLPLLKERLIVDPEPEVRSALLSNFGPLTGFLIQGDTEKGYDLVLAELLPMLHQVLSTDTSATVKSVAREALVVVTPHIRHPDRSDVVLPTVLGLAHDPEEPSCRCLAVSLLSGLAESLGCDLCTQFVVPQLCCLSEDPSSEVRTAAALSFVEICNVVGSSVTCARLLPPFCRLSSDPSWSVRRACLESLQGVAQTIPPERSAAELTPLIRRLLNDSHRLVKLSAQRALGPFISCLMTPNLIPHDLAEEYLALASLEPEETARLSASDKGRSVSDLLALHSAASLLSRSSGPQATPLPSLPGTPAPKVSLTHPASASNPPALCAYSLAAVLWTLCGRGENLTRLRRSSSERVRFDSARIRHSDDLVKIGGSCISSSDVDLQGFESCASMGGREYWWPVFRPALLTLLNKRGSESAITIRKPLAASFSLIASLVLEDLNNSVDGTTEVRCPSIDSSTSSVSSYYTAHQRGRPSDCESDPFMSIRLKGEPDEHSENVVFEFLSETRHASADSLQTENIRTESDGISAPLLDSIEEQTEETSSVEKYSSCEYPPLPALTGLLSLTSDASSDGLWKYFKSKRIRGTRQRPENLQDIEGICDKLLSDECPAVRTAMVSQLPEVLRCCPLSVRLSYIDKLLEILRSNSPCEELHELSLPDKRVPPSPPRTSLIHRFRLFSFGSSHPATPTTTDSTPDMVPRKLRECWRLRHAAALTLNKYLDLFDNPEDLRRLILPIFLQLACDAAAAVRRAVCASAASILSELCPVITFYFCHGGSVDCAFSSHRDLAGIQERAVDITIPSSAVESLPPMVRRDIQSLLSPSSEKNSPEDLARSQPINLTMKPPNFLKGPEVQVIKSILMALAVSSNHQDRITYIRICDAILRGCPKHLFQLYFLRPLVRLSGDKVRNVRWVWASTMRCHVHKQGRLGDNALMVTAAASLVSSCSNTSASSFQLPLQRVPSTNGPPLKRTSSASSIDLLVENSGSRPRSSSSSSPSFSPRQHRLNSKQSGESNSPIALSPRSPPGFFVDSSFVGTDAEIRRHLGSIVLASEGEAIWNDGLDLEDLLPIELLNKTNSSSSIEDHQSIRRLHSCSSNGSLSRQPSSSDSGSESSSQECSSEEGASSAQDDSSIAPHQSRSPRLHFLIAEPRPVSREPSIDVVGVPGMHVDELDGE